MRIENIKIKNFKAFRDVEIKDIPNFCVVVGANGTGKSTLFEIFSFIKDAMTENVTLAVQKRGGFKELMSRDSSGNIEFEITYSASFDSSLFSYFISISADKENAIIDREILKSITPNLDEKTEFDFSRGKGYAVCNNTNEEHILSGADNLAIKALAQFKKYSSITKFAELISDWHLSDIDIKSMRSINNVGYAEHLSTSGENLSLVTQYLFENHKSVFDKILDKVKHKIPGINSVEAKVTEDGRVLLKFQDGAFKDPFLSRYVSDGTIKMFAYLVLLNDPKPHQLLCIEEPENQLYPSLLMELAEEFREYSERGGQVFVSTHSPDFLNAVELDEVYWLIKKQGYTTVKRAADNELIENMMNDGDKMGYLWKQGFFEELDPE